MLTRDTRVNYSRKYSGGCGCHKKRQAGMGKIPELFGEEILNVLICPFQNGKNRKISEDLKGDIFEDDGRKCALFKR